jgi:hypothetical protein
MRSKILSEARSEVFIHQGMNCCLLAGCDAHIEHGPIGHVDCGSSTATFCLSGNWLSLEANHHGPGVLYDQY